MAMQQNTDHIQTTHIGSLPRPHKLLDILKASWPNICTKPSVSRSSSKIVQVRQGTWDGARLCTEDRKSVV